MKATAWFEDATLEREARFSTTPHIRSANSSSSCRPTPRTPLVQLNRGSIFSKALAEGECLTVAVTSGHAWITLEGDAQDHVLTAGGEREFTGSGLLVIEGLEQGARLRLENVS